MMLARGGSLVQFIGRLRPEQVGRVGDSCSNLSSLCQTFGSPDRVRAERDFERGLLVVAWFSVGKESWLRHEFLGVARLYKIPGALHRTFFGSLGFPKESLVAIHSLNPGEALTLSGPETFNASCRDEDMEEALSWITPHSTAPVVKIKCSHHAPEPTTCSTCCSRS